MLLIMGRQFLLSPVKYRDLRLEVEGQEDVSTWYIDIVITKEMVVEGVPDLATILLGCEILHMLPCIGRGKQRNDDDTNLLPVIGGGGDKRATGLEGLVLFVIHGLIGQDGNAGTCLLVNGVI